MSQSARSRLGAAPNKVPVSREARGWQISRAG